MERIDVADVRYRPGTAEDDGIIAHHFYCMWRDLGVSETDIQGNWSAITLDFIAEARQTLRYCAWVAAVDGAIVGSVSGQLFAGLYPPVLTLSNRQYGYIWGVYVEPTYRHRGIATELTRQMVNYLSGIGCTKVVLNAAPGARSLYARLGFTNSNLMELTLSDAPS